jgi:hypothetical protein
VTGSRRVEKLRRDHAVEGFDCGRDQLNQYLLRYAWQNQQAGAAQTYVGIVDSAIVGFHTLAVGQVMHEDAPVRLTKGMARHPVPIVLLARLAVASERWRCMRRMTRLDVFMSISILWRRRAIRCTCLYC